MNFNESRSICATAVAAALLAGSAPAAGAADAADAVRSATATATATAESQSAVWKARELRFVYMGFTTKYSCEGLASKVKAVLLELGARKDDLRVSATGCAAQVGHPSPFPGVFAKMNVLEPVSAAVQNEAPLTDHAAAANDSAAGDARVAAHWKAFELKPGKDPLSGSGECELVEQIKVKILPLFATRDVEYTSNCVPHQLTLSGARLRAQVLTR